ncbi:MAG: hypothetical protein WD645_02005, partial [Dehalococcoidia bacterium]
MVEQDGGAPLGADAGNEAQGTPSPRGSRKRRVAALEQYKDDPTGFVEGVLGGAGEPYGKQREFLELAATHRRVSVVGCNGSGKDWTAARIVLWWIETRPKAKAVVTGPTQRQVEEVVWREMRVAYAMAGKALRGKMYASRYVVDD